MLVLSGNCHLCRRMPTSITSTAHHPFIRYTRPSRQTLSPAGIIKVLAAADDSSRAAQTTWSQLVPGPVSTAGLPRDSGPSLASLIQWSQPLPADIVLTPLGVRAPSPPTAVARLAHPGAKPPRPSSLQSSAPPGRPPWIACRLLDPAVGGKKLSRARPGAD